MPGVIEVNLNGQKVRAIELAFEPVKEPWCEYELSDGGRVRFRAVVSRIFWLVDENDVPMRHPGNDAPNVIVTHDQQLSVNL